MRPESMNRSETEKAAAVLRMAVPRMSQHQIAATPRNYAVWYQYVEGSNPALKKRIDELLSRAVTFDDELNDSLFEEYVSECNLKRVSGIRDDIQEIIEDVNNTLAETGQQADDYGGVLDRFVRDLDEGSDTARLRELVKRLARETRDMRHATKELRERVERNAAEMEELKNQLEKVREEACTDPLTGLANRQALYDALQRVEESPSPDGDSLLLFDIDHFKRINDGYGHLVGDKVIRFVSGSIKKQAHGSALAARYGGEEFVLLLPGHSLEKAANIGEHVRKLVEDAKLVRSDTKEPLGRITLSCGIARYRPGEATTAWLERADQALYRAKESGRNRVLVEAPGAPRARAS